jgi:hypothetical protein
MGPRRCGHTGCARQRRRSRRCRLRLGGCDLLARLAFIMTEMANLPFDAEKQGSDFIALLGIKRLGRSRWTRAAGLTIADTDALHHRSYDFVGSTDRHGLLCVVCPSLKAVSYHLSKSPPRRHVLWSLVVQR